MQRHFAAAVHNYHFVPAGMLTAVDCLQKFEAEHTLFVVHKQPAELGVVESVVAALDEEQLQQVPESPVESRQSVVGPLQRRRELELELQDAQFFDAI